MSLQTATLCVRKNGELIHEELVPITEHNSITSLAKDIGIEHMGTRETLTVEFAFDPPLIVEGGAA